jgi:hypothetical protein
MKIRLKEKDLTRAQRDARDLELINRNADKLNADALDALEDQAPVDFDEDAP